LKPKPPFGAGFDQPTATRSSVVQELVVGVGQQ
jgi:hypothetical protein